MAAKPLSISLPLSVPTSNRSPSMYHRSPASGSPIFDIPEFPSMRRVKPLPKRRRVNIDEDDVPRTRPTAAGTATKDSTASPLSLDSIAPIPFDATPEELIAHAEKLKTEMAAQGYEQYLPILGGVQDLFRGVAAAAAAASAAGSGNTGNRTRGGRNSIAASVSDLGNKLSLASEALEKALAHAAAAGVGLSGSSGNLGGLNISEDDDLGDSDYLDHLQQPGNTKKRKVPANMSGSSRGHDGGSSQSGGEEDGSERERDFESGVGILSGGRSDAPPGSPRSKNTPPLSSRPSKSRLPAITIAGLQHKKTIASRKKQLADVLVSLSLGDTFSLEQALSNNYPFAAAAASLASATTNRGADPNSGPKVRLSNRSGPRLARLAKRALKFRHPDMMGLPVSEFTFRSPSETADRLATVTEEAAMLKTRFEAELARQTAKAKLAAANKMMASFPSKGSRHKRIGGGAERAQRQRTIAPPGSGKGGDQNAEFLDQGLVTSSGTKPKSGKKKKRSALANASNPHHLRNYVPSRLPHSGAGNTQNQNQAEANFLSPLPLRFLSADLAPRRKRSHNNTVQPSSNLTNPADEWICAFCEYELFFGDDQDYRRAIRQRKKILRRRRRAQERAAAAASGNSTLKGAEKGVSKDDDEDAEFDPAVEELTNLPKQTKWKGDPNKDKDEGEDEAAYG